MSQQRKQLTVESLVEAQQTIKSLGFVDKVLGEFQPSRGRRDDIRISIHGPGGVAYTMYAKASTAYEDRGLDIEAEAVALLKRSKAAMVEQLRAKGIMVAV